MMLTDSDDLAKCKEDVSKKSTSDAVIYHVKTGKTTKVVIVEVKTDQTISLDSVAQVIGYYTANQTKEEYLQIGLVMSQSKMIIVFFPFRDRSNVYLDAIVTSEIDLKENHKEVFEFIASYVYICYSKTWIIKM